MSTIQDGIDAFRRLNRWMTDLSIAAAKLEELGALEPHEAELRGQIAAAQKDAEGIKASSAALIAAAKEEAAAAKAEADQHRAAAEAAKAACTAAAVELDALQEKLATARAAAAAILG